MNDFELMTKYIEFLKKEEHGEWVINQTNDGSPEHPLHLPFVRYSQVVHSFIQDVHKFEKEHPGMKLTRYREILNEHGIEWQYKSMKEADVAQLDGQCVMALIMGAVRAERFCDGALLGLFKDGSILKWLKRLQSLDLESCFGEEQ